MIVRLTHTGRIKFWWQEHRPRKNKSIHWEYFLISYIHSLWRAQLFTFVCCSLCAISSQSVFNSERWILQFCVEITAFQSTLDWFNLLSFLGIYSDQTRYRDRAGGGGCLFKTPLKSSADKAMFNDTFFEACLLRSLRYLFLFLKTAYSLITWG